VRPILAKATLYNRRFLVDVPTVERVCCIYFLFNSIAGAIPLMYSTFGLSKRPKIVGHRRTSFLYIWRSRHTKYQKLN
jgi:hypothetical protein